MFLHDLPLDGVWGEEDCVIQWIIRNVLTWPASWRCLVRVGPCYTKNNEKYSYMTCLLTVSGERRTMLYWESWEIFYHDMPLDSVRWEKDHVIQWIIRNVIQRIIRNVPTWLASWQCPVRVGPCYTENQKKYSNMTCLLTESRERRTMLYSES